MSISFLRFNVTSLALLALMQGAAAQTTAGAAADEGCALRVATGPSGKVYERLFADIRKVCGDVVSLCPVPSEGGLQNLSLLSASRADIGMAQVDTLESMKAGDDNVRLLQAVMPLHSNLLHVVSLATGSTIEVSTLLGRSVPGTGRRVVVQKFSELKGLSIAAVGSAQLMATVLDQQLGYGLKIENVDTDDQALAKLRAGQVQAVLTTVGWPSPVISRLQPDAYRLVEYDLKPAAPYQVVKRNYQNLRALNHPFLAAPNLLLSHSYKTGGVYFKRVAALQRCLLQNLDDMQEGGFHPAWKEIQDPTQAYGVALFRGVLEPTAVAVPTQRRDRRPNAAPTMDRRTGTTTQP